MADIKENSQMEANISKLMKYLDTIREIGALDIFTQLFQSDYRIINYLYTHHNIHPSVIASDLNISRPNVAANLRILESKRYIVRTIDASNHRQVFVDITPMGIRYLEIVKQQCERLFMDWFKILGEEEVEHLFKILEMSSKPYLITKEVKQVKLGSL